MLVLNMPMRPGKLKSFPVATSRCLYTGSGDGNGGYLVRGEKDTLWPGSIGFRVRVIWALPRHPQTGGGENRG